MYLNNIRYEHGIVMPCKEGNLVICEGTDKPGGHHVKWISQAQDKTASSYTWKLRDDLRDSEGRTMV